MISDTKQTSTTSATNTDIHHVEKKSISSGKQEKDSKKHEGNSNKSASYCSSVDGRDKHHNKISPARHIDKGDGKDGRWDKKSTHKKSKNRQDSNFDHSRQEMKSSKKHDSSSSKLEGKHESRHGSHRRHDSSSDHHRNNFEMTEARSHRRISGSDRRDSSTDKCERHVSGSDRRDSNTDKYERENSSDRLEGRSKKWDGCQQDDVVKHLTSHQHHQLGDKGNVY